MGRFDAVLSQAAERDAHAAAVQATRKPTKRDRKRQQWAQIEASMAEAKAREQKAREAREALQAQARDRAEAMQLVNLVKRFGNGFLDAVEKFLRHSQLGQAEACQVVTLAEALLCREDKQLPDMRSELRDEIIDRFVYGVYLMVAHDNPLPDGLLVGQRLDNFAELMAAKTAQVEAAQKGRQLQSA